MFVPVFTVSFVSLPTTPQKEVFRGGTGKLPAVAEARAFTRPVLGCSLIEMKHRVLSNGAADTLGDGARLDLSRRMGLGVLACS